MGYIVGTIALFFCGISYKTRKDLLNPVCFFSLLWGIVCILSAMKLYGFTGANTYEYAVIGVGILSYSVAASSLLNKSKPIRFVWGKNVNIKDKWKSDNINKGPTMVNEKALWMMTIIVFCYTIYKFKLALPFILMNNTLGYVRTIYLQIGAGITINALDYLINTFVIAGMRLTCEIILINEMISRRKVHKLLYIMLGLIIVMNVLLTGGRMILLDLSLYILFAVKLNGFKTQYKLNRWQKIAIVFLGSVIVYGMLYITKDRQGNNTVMESIYGNFTGGVSLFNTIVENVLKEKWTYGTMFFYAVLSLAWTPLNYFLHIPYPMTFKTFDMLVSPFYNVGKSTMNAYITCWGFFYADFRIIGVIVFSAVFGLVLANYYNRYRITRSPEDICSYMLMANVMFYSIIRWQLANSSYILALVLIPLMYKRNYNKSKSRS